MFYIMYVLLGSLTAEFYMATIARDEPMSMTGRVFMHGFFITFWIPIAGLYVGTSIIAYLIEDPFNRDNAHDG